MFDLEQAQKRYGPSLERTIERALPRKGIPNLNNAAWHHLDAGGKRLRGLFAILSCEAFGGNPRDSFFFAAACELMHNWMLVHDDIEDGDKVRRGKPTVWAQYGQGHGVNVGDYMQQGVNFALLRSYVDDATFRNLASLLTNASMQTINGQAMDMNLRQRKDVTEAEYMKMVRRKTGHYLVAPLIGGAMIAGVSDDKVLSKIRSYGKFIGPAFQIADDLIDVTEGKGRGEIGCDIKEGKRSMLVVRVATVSSDSERNRMFSILDKPREKTTEKDVKYVLDLFRSYDVIAYAQRKTEELLQAAKSTVQTLPDKPRELLHGIADYLAERKS